MSEADRLPVTALLAPGRHRAMAAAARLDSARAAAFAAGASAAEAAAAARIAGLEAQLAAERSAHAAARAAADAHAAAAAQAIVAALASALATLGLAVARAVLDAEPRTPSDWLAANLARLLADLPAGTAGRLFHAPGAPLPAVALPPGWDLAVDDALAGDALRAEVGDGTLGISLAQQLAAALDRLEGVA